MIRLWLTNNEKMNRVIPVIFKLMDDRIKWKE